jgi:hypothetical protein
MSFSVQQTPFNEPQAAVPDSGASLVLLSSRDHRATTRSLRVRGLESQTVDEVRRRVVRGREVEDRVNLLPGRVFVDENTLSRLVTGRILPGDSDDLPRELGVRVGPVVPALAVAEWRAWVDGEGERLSAWRAEESRVRYGVGDAVLAYLPGGGEIRGTVLAVGTRYVRVRRDDTGRTLELRHGLVAPGGEATEGKSRSHRQRRRRAWKRARRAAA